MNIEDLSPEVLEKAKACKTPEEMFALAKSEGIELTEEQLDAINGGGIIDWDCLLDMGLMGEKDGKPHKHHH